MLVNESVTILACPQCLSRLEQSAESSHCRLCERTYGVSAYGQLDFRPVNSCSISMDYSYDPEFGRFPWNLVQLEWSQNELPFTVPAHWEATELGMIRSVPKAESSKRAIDLGCGTEHQRFKEPLQMLGYESTGVDFDGAAPDILADLHLLPFRDESFDLLLTSAVFEHLKNPHVAMAEAARIAKEGSLFVGSIAFSEPYHISYFHCSPLATYELLTSTGFEVQAIILSRNWNVFNAHFEMGYAGARYPSMMRNLLAATIVRASLLPSAIKSLIHRNPQHLKDHELIFAKSHSAAIGFIAVRKRRLNETQIRRLSRKAP
jgi:SAM-dependent methyltransferase